MPAEPVTDERAGCDMLYSSGTTGKPKGVSRSRCRRPGDRRRQLADRAGDAGLRPSTGDAVYLSPAPLYHAAPLRWSMTVHRLGGTVVVMEKFDAEEALAAIEQYRVTDSQWVPTHFVRMLKLPEDVRSGYDLSPLSVRDPRGRALPGPGQARDDRMVGAGHL